MSNGEVKRWSVDELTEEHWSNRPANFYINETDHERIVAKLRSEIEQHNALHEHEAMALGRLSARIDNQAFLLSENTKTIASQKRVIEKLKTYVQHRVDCICRAGVLQYSDSCDCGLDAIEKGEA